MKAGFELAGRWKIIDGPDLLTIWLAEDGFKMQRIKNFNSTEAVGNKIETMPYEDLVLATEGQRKLL